MRQPICAIHALAGFNGGQGKVLWVLDVLVTKSTNCIMFPSFLDEKGRYVETDYYFCQINRFHHGHLPQSEQRAAAASQKI